MAGIVCSCIDSSVKAHLEGALIHYIREIQKDVITFTDAAIEAQEIDSPMTQHYFNVASSSQEYIERLEEAKQVIKEIPDCKEE